MDAQAKIPIPFFKTGNGCADCDNGDKPVWENGHYGHRYIDLVKERRWTQPCTNPLLKRYGRL